MANHIFRIYLGSQDLPTYGIGGQWKFVRGADETANLDFNISSDDVSGVYSPVDGDDLQLALEDVSTIGAGNVITRSLANCIFLLDFNGATTGTITMSFAYDITIDVDIVFTISGTITAAALQAEFDEQVSSVEVREVEAGNKFTIEFRGSYEGLPVAAPPEWPATIANDGTDETVTLKQLTFSGYVNAWTVEFTGSLADTLISDASVSSVSLVGFAGTITTTVDQEGIEDVSITADISVYVEAIEAVSPVNEVQRISTSGNGGSFDLSDADSLVTVNVTSSAGALVDFQDKLDTIFGSGNTLAGNPSSNEWTITFQGTLAGTPIGEVVITNQDPGAGYTVTTDTQGVEEVIGVHQVTRIALSGVATNGGLQYDSGLNINYDNSNTDIASNWATFYSETVSVTGSPADEIIDIEHTEDYDDHALPTETLNTLVIAGLPTRIAIAKQDSPDSGNFTITQDAGTYQGDDYDSFVTASIAFDATYGAVATALSSGVGGQFDWTGISGDGSPGDPWIIESVEHCDPTILAASLDLGKSIGIELVTLQAGSGGGGGGLLIMALQQGNLALNGGMI